MRVKLRKKNYSIVRHENGCRAYTVLRADEKKMGCTLFFA